MGLTRIKAEQISDIDYKQAVRAIQTTNITLVGGAPSTVDSVNLVAGDRVLVTGQDTGSENGIYYVSTLGTGANGTWTRTTDANQTGEIEAGMIVMVTEGTTYADTQWKLITNDPIVVGTTPLSFTINILSSVGGSNTQIQYNSAGTLAGSANLTWDGANLTVGGAILPAANVTYSLGSTAARWQDLWIANSSIYIGDVVLATTGPALTINGANVLTGNAGAAFSTTGNVTGGNLLTLGVVSATGNITGDFLLGNGSQLTGLPATYGNANVVANLAALSSNPVSTAGNVTSGNFLSTGIASITGNITTANFFIGNGSQLTGIAAEGIQFTSQANTPPAGPNNGDFWFDTFTDIKYQYINDGDSSQWVDQSAPTTFSTISTNQIVNSGSNGTGNIGSVAGFFNNLYITDISLTGNIVDTGELTFQTGSNGNITLNPNGTGVIVANKDIRNGQANGVGNIGTSTGYFNTIFAKATSAQYADLAEFYQSDMPYDPGTVVVFGGDKEITTTDKDHDTRVAGVVSTDPAFIMNSGSEGLAVALTGRVPCRVKGPVDKGDVLVTSNMHGVAQRLGDRWQPGCVLGKSLSTIKDDQVRQIEIVVGRF